MKTILRVFPAQTSVTPSDDLCRFDEPGLFDPPECDEVHVSCVFTWHRGRANRLAEAWSKCHANVKIGGPAFGDRGGEFVPSRYLQFGNIITSRGCPERCWFCDVWRREGNVRELPIVRGWRVHDSNLLACSRHHQEAVFRMLEDQRNRPEFVGGLQAARLTEWHIKWLRRLKPRRMYFAYDTADDLEPLRSAGKLLEGFKELYCYVLIGYPGDSVTAAETRLHETIAAGFLPFAMLYRDSAGCADNTWRRFQREWCRPAIVRTKMCPAARLAGDCDDG